MRLLETHALSIWFSLHGPLQHPAICDKHFRGQAVLEKTGKVNSESLHKYVFCQNLNLIY